MAVKIAAMPTFDRGGLLSPGANVAMERVSRHRPRRRAEVALTVLVGGEIFDHRRAATGKTSSSFVRIESPRPRLADGLTRSRICDPPANSTGLPSRYPTFESSSSIARQRGTGRSSASTRRLGLSGTPVTDAPADVLTSTVEAMLCDAGFASSSRSVVIWEGVTNCLSGAAVQRFAVSAHRSRLAASSYSRRSIAG
jgi:hypothetical protein